MTTDMNPLWAIHEGRGFLPAHDPCHTFLGTDCGWDDARITALETIVHDLPVHMQRSDFRATLAGLPISPMQSLIQHNDPLLVERAFQIYSFLASAYVFQPDQAIAQHLPVSIARPLVQLATALDRPPILSYASYTLLNWRRIDPDADLIVENLELLCRFIAEKDAAWFTLIHVDIEARAADGLCALRDALPATQQGDDASLMQVLMRLADSLDAMMATFKRMPEHCRPDVYYTKVRPYIFSFEGIVYEGVDDEMPRHYNGETGAQSSIIPAMVAGLGLRHEATEMTRYTTIMRTYMPREHRQAIMQLANIGLRDAVIRANTPALRDAYNHTLQRLLAFRKMHLSFARMYIADHVEDPRGTGGTHFMHWLKQLSDETASHLL